MPKHVSPAFVVFGSSLLLGLRDGRSYFWDLVEHFC